MEWTPENRAEFLRAWDRPESPVIHRSPGVAAAWRPKSGWSEDPETILTEVRATPEGFTVSVWVCTHLADPATAALAYPFLTAGERPPDETLTLGRDRFEREDLDWAECLDEEIYALERATLRTARTAPLLARVPGLVIDTCGGICPFQAEGTLHGHPFYFRYRGGVASLRVGGQDCILEPLWWASTEYGDPAQGHLTYAEFTDLFTTLVTNLTRAPWHYTFDHPDPREDSTWPYLGARGHTVEEAWASALEAGGLPADLPRPTPTEPDTRVFPATDPPFTALPAPAHP